MGHDYMAITIWAITVQAITIQCAPRTRSVYAHLDGHSSIVTVPSAFFGYQLSAFFLATNAQGSRSVAARFGRVHHGRCRKSGLGGHKAEDERAARVDQNSDAALAAQLGTMGPSKDGEAHSHRVEAAQDLIALYGYGPI